MVEGQRVPENMVQPVVSQDLQVRISTLRQQVTSQRQLQQLLLRTGVARTPQAAEEMVDGIRSNVGVTLVPDLTSGPQAKKKPGQVAVPGFFVTYTAPNAREAQQICNELTSVMITENSNFVAAAAKGTTDVLDKGLEDAKLSLDDLDAKLAAFKKQNSGQLPGDEDKQLQDSDGVEYSTGAEHINPEPGAAGQDLYRGAAGAAIVSVEVVRVVEQSADTGEQLSDLQSQLLQLQARYTADSSGRY